MYLMQSGNAIRHQSLFHFFFSFPNFLVPKLCFNAINLRLCRVDKALAYPQKFLIKSCGYASLYPPYKIRLNRQLIALKLCLGMPVSQRNKEPFLSRSQILFGNSFKNPLHFAFASPRMKAFPNGVWEREKGGDVTFEQASVGCVPRTINCRVGTDQRMRKGN